MIIDINRYHKRAIDLVNRETLLWNQKYRTVAFVLDSRGRFLREGWNSFVRTHPIQKRAAEEAGMGYKEYLHAEVHALTRLTPSQRRQASGIVVIRLNQSMEMRLAKPCPICKSVIESYQIGHIVHS